MSTETLVETRSMSREALLRSDLLEDSTSHVFCLAARPRALQRFDLWIGPDSAVLHAGATDPRQPAPVVTLAASLAAVTVASLVGRTFGMLPTAPGAGRTSLPCMDDLLPAIVRSEHAADRALVFGARRAGSARYLVLAELAGRGLLGQSSDPALRLRLEPATAVTMWAEIVRLVT